MVWGGLINNPEVVSGVRNLIHMSSKQFYDVKSPNTLMHLIIIGHFFLSTYGFQCSGR